jgi:hypothetical protein
MSVWTSLGLAPASIPSAARVPQRMNVKHFALVVSLLQESALFAAAFVDIVDRRLQPG